MSRRHRFTTKVVAWLLVTSLTAPYAFAQAPATAPAQPSSPAAPPSSPVAEPAPAEQGPFKRPLAESLTGMARAEYEAGKVLYVDGDYAGAALKFQAAYDESKDPRLLWNIAAAEKNLRRYARVVEFVERYLSEAGTRLSKAEREEAETLLTTVRGFIATANFEVTPEGATVYIDDVAVGVSPLREPVRVEMGERKIRVSKQGFVDFTSTQTFQGGGTMTLAVALQAEVHQGRLRVVAGQGDSISVDGQVVGTSEWEGVLPSGIHTVTVTAPGRVPYQSDVAIQDDQAQSLRVALVASAPAPKEGKNLTWLWIAGGSVLAVGLGVGAYFAFKPDDEVPVEGTLGNVELPLFGRF